MKWDLFHLEDAISFRKIALGEAVKGRMKNAIIKTKRENYSLSIAFHMRCSKDWFFLNDVLTNKTGKYRSKFKPSLFQILMQSTELTGK